MNNAKYNRPPKIFLTHASADNTIALRIAKSLQENELDVAVDVKDVQLGESFVTFMMKAMEESDYCITLWSKNVNLESFIGEEIAAAFIKSVKERRSFWIIARLDNSSIPALYQARIYVSLFPEIESGLHELMTMIKLDRDIQISSQKLVIPGPNTRSEDEEKIEIYICSSLFDRTVVWSISPTTKGDELLCDVIKMLGIPKQLSYQDRVGVLFEYRLRGAKGALEHDKIVISQGVHHQSVIWLEVEVRVFAVVKPVEMNSEGKLVYRTGVCEQKRVGRHLQKQALQHASVVLSKSLRSAGVRKGKELTLEELEARLSTN